MLVLRQFFLVFSFLFIYVIGIFSGCENQGANTLQCLRSAPSKALIRAGNLITAAASSTLFLFAPVLGGQFLQERPIEAFTAGRFSSVPMLAG